MKQTLKSVAIIIGMVICAAITGWSTELITNGGFDSGSTGWTLSGGATVSANGNFQQAGTMFLFLGGVVNEKDAAYQDIAIPGNATTATLSFYYNINSIEGNTTAFDTFSATIRNTSGTVLKTVGNWSNIDQTLPGSCCYTHVTLDLLQYAGQTIRIYFASTNDSSNITNFRVDTVSVSVTTVACSYSLSSSSANPSSAAGSSSFTVTTGSSCAWTAVSDATSWLHTSSGTTGSGTVNYTYDANGNSNTRVGHITVGVQTFTVTQLGTTPCSYSLSSSSANPSSATGSSSFTVTTGSSCAWTAVSDVTSWLHTSSGTTGNGTVSYSYDVNTTPSIRTGHISVGSQTFAVTQAAGTVATSPLAGKGDWIHKMATAIASVPAATTAQDLINYEKNIGVNYLIVKAAEGNDPYPFSGMQLNSAFVNACHAAGLKVFGFHYVYGGAYQGRVLANGQPDANFDNINSSVNSEISIAIQILDTGCDGLIIDAESAYEDLALGATITPGDGDPTRFYYPGTLPPNPSLPPVAAQSAATAAQAYCSGILSARPTAFLAHAPFFNPSSHSFFPYITFGKYCAAVLPQAYYRFNGLTPESTVAAMDSQWKTLQNSWINSGHPESVKPLFPIGYSASPATGADITDFVNLLNTDPSPATTGGYQGASFWDADLQTSGIWSAIASATIGSAPNLDTTAPTISAFSVSPSASITIGNSFTASYTVSDSGGSGLKQVVLRRTSGDGSANDPGWQDIQTVTITGNGPVSGSFNPDTPPSAATYWYGMAAFDNANNSKDERASGLGPLSRTVSQDTTPPTVAITSPPSGTTYTTAQTVVIIASASDNVGLMKVDFYDGATFVTSNPMGPYGYGWAITSANNGVHTWTARAYDTAGNITTSIVVTLTVNIPVPDTTPPTVSISSPPSGTAYTTAQTVSINASASDNIGVTKVDFYDGTTFILSDTTSSYSYGWSITSANNGTHTWTARAYDTAGNVTTSIVASLMVNIPVPDTTPPTVTISSPSSGTTYTTAQTVTINASASDNVGVTKVDFYDGTTLTVSDSTSPYAYSWVITSANNGAHSWTARAYDAAGNVTTSVVATLTVNIPVPDTTPPTVSISSPSSGTTYTAAQTVSINASASDNIGVTKVDFYDGTTFILSDTTAPYSYGWSIVSANNGTHSWTARAYDAAGNVTTSMVVTLTVNISPELCNNGSANRIAPMAYTDGVANHVTIVATPQVSVGNYALEDAPPSGWTASNIDNNGIFDSVNHKVKWGPFFDNTARTFGYDVTPTNGTTGIQCFAGIVSFDGGTCLVTGSNCIDQLVATSLPGDTNCDWRVSISELTAYGACWKNGCTWTTPACAVAANPTPISYITRAGYLWKNGETYHFDGTQVAPLCWVLGAAPLKAKTVSVKQTTSSSTATRSLPASYTPSVAVTVSISTTPDVAVGVYAVEDVPPSGWTASNINNSGIWDSINQKVKWGPFFDNTARTFTYQATPPVGATGTQTFSGTASFDGNDIAVGGTSDIGQQICTDNIATSVSPVGGGIISGDGTVGCGSNVTVVATPNTCYQFVNWTENAVVVSSSASYSFTATGNRTLVANFSQPSYTITTSSSPSVGGTTSGAGTKTCGSGVTVIATPNSGYNFVNWTEGGTAVSTSANYTFTAAGNRTLVANFTPVLIYTVSTSSSPTEGGTNSGGGTYTSGATVNVHAAPNTCYQFVNWTEGGVPVSASASYSFTASGNRTLVANFDPLSQTLLFSDDFNDNSIDSNKWIASGNSVAENNQMMQVSTTVTDAGGNLTNVPFPVNSTNLITITRQVYMHHGTNNFEGAFDITLGSLPTFSVQYANIDFSDSTYMPRFGFFLSRNGSRPDVIADKTDVSASITPVWDTWFNEKITYDPVSGVMEYFINDVSQLMYHVGVLSPTEPATMTMHFNAWGWFADHQHNFDDLIVSQSGCVVPKLEMNVVSLGMKLNFTKHNADSCKVQTQAQFSNCSNPAGMAVALNIGDVQVPFTIGTKGRGFGSNGTCRIKYNKKTGLCVFSANINRGNWSDFWSAYGLSNTTTSVVGNPVLLPVILVIGDEAFTADKVVVYKAKAGKSGSAK